MTKAALITGVTGQDGSYIADMLLEKGYDVYGLVRRSANPNPWRIEHILNKITLLDGDMTDMGSLVMALKESNPSEVCHMAGQSFVPTSFKNKVMTFETNALGTAKLLEAIQIVVPDAKMVHASSSEIYGHVREVPQRETTPPYPRSPYGVSKLAAMWLTINAREASGTFACNSICFNHESERRGEQFVTRKVTMYAAALSNHKNLEPLHLGNLDAKRDWGYAPDFVRAMWLMLQQKEPDDFVISTGKQQSVRDLCRVAFEAAGIPDWESHVTVDDHCKRPSDVETLLGDSTKAKSKLGWEPTVTFEEMITRMVNADIDRLETQ